MNYTHIPSISCLYAEELTSVLTAHPLMEPDAHFEYEMILVTEGQATMMIGNKQYALRKGSLAFISRLERHSFLIGSESYNRYVVTASGDFITSNIKDMDLASIFLLRPKDFCHVIDLGGETYERLCPLFARLAGEYEAQQVFHTSYIAAVITAILIDLYRTVPEAFPTLHYKHTARAVLNAQRYITDHFDQKISLQEIASQNYLCAHSLSIAFKDIAGASFKDYLILYRIAEAKKLLVSTDLSVAEIAGQVGYSNVNNFIRIFRSRETLTPLQYRKQHQSPQK